MSLILRRGKPADLKQILRVSDVAFRKQRNWFSRYYPHAYPGPAATRCFVVCEDRGRIVGLINQTPMVLRIGGARLQVVGIGGVATLPECRGHGVMSKLLKFSNAWQQEAGTHAGILWGARQRYRRYGYEHAGTQYNIHIDLKVLPDLKAVPLRRLTVKDAGVLRRLSSLSDSSVQRDQRWQKLLLQRLGYKAYGNKQGRLRAYLVTPRDQPGEIIELIGDPQFLPGIVKAQMQRHRLQNLSFPHLPGNRASCQLALEASRLTAGCATQLNIFDFGHFLTALRGELGKNFRRYGIKKRVCLTHREEGRRFALQPRATGGLTVKELKPKGGADLALDQAGWVRVFFPPPGGSMLSGKADHRLLAALQLPLIISRWETV